MSWRTGHPPLNGACCSRWAIHAHARAAFCVAREACEEMQNITGIVLVELGAAFQFARGTLATLGQKPDSFFGASFF